MVDSFFVTPTSTKKRKRSNAPRTANSRSKSQSKPVNNSLAGAEQDEEITSESEFDEQEGGHISDIMAIEGESEDEFADETEADKRRRLAKEYLASIEEEITEDFDAADLDREIISRRLKQDVAEQQGRIYRFIADKLQLHVVNTVEQKAVNIYEQKAYGITYVAAHYPHCFTVSKDLTLAKWDISRPGGAKLLKSVRGNHKRAQDPEYRGHVDEILAVAVSPDGKLVVTGGKDRKIIVWTKDNLTPIKVFDTRDRKGVVTGFAFRRKTNELYVSCADLKVRTYNLTQLAQVETLFGHQDQVADIAALAQERCLTVGSRDRTAIVWKISEESRLTYRGGESRKADNDSKILEGSIDCCTMLDDQLFVTGSDNGNISLWAANKKKPIFVRRECHGRDQPLSQSQASGESDASKVMVPAPQPRYITSLYAIPFSDVFFSGSWSGDIKVWKLGEDMRSFEQIGAIEGIKGVINRISVVETGKRGKETFQVCAGVSRELRLGRWIKVKGKNGLAEAVIHSS